MSNRINLDWYNTFLQATQESEPPTIYRKWVAISTIVATLERKCWLVMEAEIFANMYIILVGPAACRKGTAMAPGKEILKRIGENLCAESITMEALVRRLKKSLKIAVCEDETQITHNSLTIYSSELAVFLGEYKRSPRFLSYLANWYDCEENWAYETKTQGDEIIDAVWVNIIGATTPDLLKDAIPIQAVGGGLSSRIIYVYAMKKEKTIAWPLKPDMSALVTDAEMMHTLQGEFAPSQEWRSLYTNWYDNLYDNPPFEDYKFDAYMERRQTHLRKLSMAFCASRSDDMILEKEDFDRALSLLVETERAMKWAFSGMGQVERIEFLPRLKATILSHGSITRDELITIFHQDLPTDVLMDFLKTLVIMKEVTIEGGRGKEVVITWVRKGEEK